MKRLKFLTVSLVALLVIAGCGSSNSPNQTGGTNGNSSAPASDVTLNIAVQRHSAVDALEVLLKDFEAETGIKAKFDVLPQNELKSKTELAMAGGTGEYDVIMFDYVQNSQYAKAGWILDLTDYIESRNVDTSDFFPGFLESYQYEGRQYAIPFFGESLILMYNKDIFEEAGITAPPATMDELIETSQKIRDAGHNAIAIRGARGEGMNVFTWSSFFLAYGAEWFDENGVPSVNSPEAIQATEVYANLLNEYGPPGAANFTWDQVQLSMQQGNVGMVIDSLNFAPRLENPENSTVVGKVGYAAIPSGPAAQVTGLGTWGMAIPADSKNPDKAFEFINWANSAEIQLKTSIDGERADATRQSVWESEEFKAKYTYENWTEVATESLAKAERDYRPGITQWRQLGDRVSIAISETLAGEDAKKALDAAQKDVEDIRAE
ncbi:ABC transporter substrate-binding protein [Paenibacillus senegalensis]|uniref:ABC transporter substrate-binding protein n=1 Tax=Paenibacillus senegalensis TaxID=1465766 RepID=UPI0002897726|nr:sugar ABC transporter substrate-binding protein [Paenibacillus senegalensis]